MIENGKFPYPKGSIISLVALAASASAQTIFTPGNPVLVRTPAPTQPDGSPEPLFNQPVGNLTGLFGLINSPVQSSGVAIFDVDNDGDADLYVTNGPGGDNSLLINDGTGALTAFTGLSSLYLNEFDCKAACAADFDNDGFTDVYVTCLRNISPGSVTGLWQPSNFLLRNENGNNLNVLSVNAPGNGGAFHCSVADFNGDGFVDIFLPNNYHDQNFTGLTGMVEFQNFNASHLLDQLYLSNANPLALDFNEVGSVAGINNHNAPTTTEILPNFVSGAWDYDYDGDIDLFVGGDQGPGFFGLIFASTPDIRGILRRFNNNGQGIFTDNSPPEFDAPLTGAGVWMGVAAADYDCDASQTIDHFWSNVGAMPTVLFNLPGVLNPQLFLTGQDFSSLTTSPSLTATGGNLTFGWGSVPIDFDNDGDFDIATMGDLASAGFPVNMKDDVGILWENTGSCSGSMSWRQGAFDTSFHMHRMDFGLAVGDINGDGLDDLVSASNADIPLGFDFDNFTLTPLNTGIGGEFGRIILQSPPLGGGVFNNQKPLIGAYNPGTVVVETNAFSTTNNFIKVVGRGGFGKIDGAVVNRDCIGCTITVLSSMPVMSGSSISGTDFFTKNFGLGTATSADVTVRFPQSNRVLTFPNIPASTRLVVPELPCDQTDTDCLADSLQQAVSSGLITFDEAQPVAASLGITVDPTDGAGNDDDDDEIEGAELAGIIIAAVVGCVIITALTILVGLACFFVIKKNSSEY